MAFKFVSRLTLLAGLAIFALSASAGAEPYRIVGFGDSLMAGYGLDAGQSFPDKLEAALRAKGHDVVIARAGVSGDTTSGGLARLDWSVPDGTRLVILELGANDMLRAIDPKIAEKNLDAVLARLKERKIAVLLAGMRAAPNLGPDYQSAFDAIYPRLAEKYGVALYPFFLDGVAADPALLLKDGMHPNAKGIDRMVERMLPQVEKAIAANPANS
ncbi:MAG: arylesterase [Hyphomicrobiales bacterium]|nr:arylesterase [Hyphomicrobiales bacterium]